MSDSLEERLGKARSSIPLRTYLTAFFIKFCPHEMEHINININILSE